MPLKTRSRPKQEWLLEELHALVEEARSRGEACLPSERELGERFQVSRVTVRNALASLEELGETILTVREASQSNNPTIELPKAQEEAFSKEFTRLLTTLQQANSIELDKQLEEKTIGEIFALCSSHLGKEGVPFVLGYFASAIGYGSITQELCEKISPSQRKRVIQYFVKHPELHKQLADILG